jgi:regulator of protease activity HflC (stomatin/prohibitin superfamily)
VVVAALGDDDFVEEKIVKPAIRAVLRDNGERVDALDYLNARSLQQQMSLLMFSLKIREYGINGDDVLIGDIMLDETLLKTQTDRILANEQVITFQQQQLAAEKAKELNRAQQSAEEERNLAKAEYSAKIAEQEAERIRKIADAKAYEINKYQQAVGASVTGQMEILKLQNQLLQTAGEHNLKITPEVMACGDSGSASALMGTILRQSTQK